MNNNTENHMKNYSTCLDCQQTQQQKSHHEIPGKPWEVVGITIFILHNKSYFCIVDYHSKFPVIKKMEDLSADS